MEVSKDFLEAVRAKHFARMHESRRWWKELTKEERKAAFDRWLEKNPDDFRAGWGLETISLTNGTIQEIWELNTGK